MSAAQFLEKLLDGAEVEWVPLKEISEVRSGWGFPNAYQGNTKGDCPFYKVSDMNIIGNETMMDSANNYIDNEVIKKLGISPAPAGTIIFPKIGAAVATNKKRILLLPSAYDNNVIGLIPNDRVMSRFLFYWMQTINLSTLANDSGAVPSIRKSKMEEHRVPIPCPDDPKTSLAIQAEIVRILDAFTALTAELTAELTARKKQYNYYRDQLLTFSDDANVEWKPLGDVIELKRGKRLVKSQLEETGDYAVYQNSMTPLGYYHKSNVESDTAFIICAGAAGEIGYSDTEFWAADDVYICLNPENISSKFIYHCLLNQQNKILAQVRRASIPRLSKTAIEKLKIPIPYANDPQKSREEQARIVSILDKFDALTNSISEGLPREIELRQKQYEYYRDLLLNFPKPTEEAA
jgi:type I restriction enzyme S subunit